MKYMLTDITGMTTLSCTSLTFSFQDHSCNIRQRISAFPPFPYKMRVRISCTVQPDVLNNELTLFLVATSLGISAHPLQIS